MLDGMKYANEGMIQMSMKQDLITNNLANANTAGFRRETSYISSFSDVLNQHVGFNPMKGGRGEYNGYLQVGGGLEVTGGMRQDSTTGFSQGSLRQTGNDFDLALQDNSGNPCFFTVQAGGQTLYTRNGVFHNLPDGSLVTADNAKVMGKDGKPINIGKASRVEVKPDGTVLADGVPKGKLAIVQFTNINTLKRAGSNNFADGNSGVKLADAGSFKLQQGYVEQGNVNPVSEMVELMQVSRAFEANQKMLQTEDQVLKKAANELGKIH